MSAQFLTRDRLASIAHSRSSKRSPYAARELPGEAALDRDDYRSFIVERRMPASHPREKILADWLVQRKSKSVNT